MNATPDFEATRQLRDAIEVTKHIEEVYKGRDRHAKWLANRPEESTELHTIWNPSEYNLRETQLSALDLPYTDFTPDAKTGIAHDFTLSNFTHSRLRGSDFRGSIIRTTNFSSADLSDSKMDFDSFQN